MRTAAFLAILGSCLILSHCASTSGTIRNQERISQIKMWQMVYSSRTRVTRNYINDLPTSAQVEQGRVSSRPKSELQFPGTILSHLRNKFGLPLATDTSEVHAQMSLEAGVNQDGKIVYVDVRLYDLNQELLAQTRIYNGLEHEHTFGYTDAFAEYAAGKIAELVDAR